MAGSLHFLLLLLFVITPLKYNGEAASTNYYLSHQAGDQAEPYASKRFYLNNTANLTVFTVSGDIEVVHNPDIDHLRVDLYVNRGYSIWPGSRNLDNYRIIMMQRGDQVNATVERKTRDGGWSNDNMTFTFIVQTPKNISSNLRTLRGSVLLQDVTGQHVLHSNSGNISIDGITGQVQANSSAGSVGIDRFSGQLNARTVAGSVHIARSEGEIRIRTVSGSITGSELEGTLVCATASGNIDAGFRDISHGVHAETASGNVTLFLPRERGYALDVRGMNIDLGEMQPFQGDIRSSSAKGRVGDGSIPIQVSTASGRVVIRNNVNSQ